MIATLEGDDKAVEEAILNWLMTMRDEQSHYAAEVTSYYNEEFERRKREKKEEAFWTATDREQNTVNQLWQEAYAMDSSMQVYYKLQEIAWNNDDTDYYY